MIASRQRGTDELILDETDDRYDEEKVAQFCHNDSSNDLSDDSLEINGNDTMEWEPKYEFNDDTFWREFFMKKSRFEGTVNYPLLLLNAEKELRELNDEHNQLKIMNEDILEELNEKENKIKMLKKHNKKLTQDRNDLISQINQTNNYLQNKTILINKLQYNMTKNDNIISQLYKCKLFNGLLCLIIFVIMIYYLFGGFDDNGIDDESLEVKCDKNDDLEYQYRELLKENNDINRRNIDIQSELYQIKLKYDNMAKEYIEFKILSEESQNDILYCQNEKSLCNNKLIGMENEVKALRNQFEYDTNELNTKLQESLDEIKINKDNYNKNITECRDKVNTLQQELSEPSMFRDEPSMFEEICKYICMFLKFCLIYPIHIT